MRALSFTEDYASLVVSRGPFLGHKPSHSAPYPASRLFPKRTLLHNCSRLQHRQFSVSLESPCRLFARFLTDFGVHWDKQSAQCAEPALRRYQRSQNQLGVPWESLLQAYTEVQTRDRPISYSALFSVDMELHWGDQSAQCTGPALP